MKGENIMLDNRVETFLVLCDIMNYTKTAETLHITQPAVTQQIRWLEEYYGCRLFSYQGKVLRLTEKGETLRRLAQQMTANAQGILQEMQRDFLPVSWRADKTESRRIQIHEGTDQSLQCRKILRYEK